MSAIKTETVLDVTRCSTTEQFFILLESAARLSQSFALMFDQRRGESANDRLAAELLPFLLSSRRTRHWPGTDSADWKLRREYAITQGSMGVLKLYASGIWDFDDQEGRPADLHFLRSDQSPVLVSVLCERRAWFVLRPGESISSSASVTLGLVSPSMPQLRHTSPAWGASSDSVLLDSVVGTSSLQYEEVAAKSMANSLFQVCCIPFYGEDLALGDVVHAELQDNRWIRSGDVLYKSGRLVVDIEVPPLGGDVRVVLEALARSRRLFEMASPDSIVVDVPDEVETDKLFDKLHRLSYRHPGISFGLR